MTTPLISLKPKRHNMPLEQRIHAYNEALRLRRQGLSYNKIVQEVHRLAGLRITASHVEYWVRGVHSPFGNINYFDGKPSPEFSSLIGVVLSDGNLYAPRDRHNYGLWLKVKDKEYAEAFGRNVARLLRKKKPYKPWWSQSQQRWIAEADSVLLFKKLDKPWYEHKPYVEHCSDCVAAFLRAFFDGEGTISGRKLYVYNTNKALLIYIQHLLLCYFGIKTTGPRPTSTKPGRQFRDPRTGKTYECRKACYELYVPVDYLQEFHNCVGFAIKRKQRRLLKAIQR